MSAPAASRILPRSVGGKWLRPALRLIARASFQANRIFDDELAVHSVYKDAMDDRYVEHDASAAARILASLGLARAARS